MEIEIIDEVTIDLFADKYVVDDLIKEFQIQKNILKKLVIKKHNSLVDRVELLELKLDKIEKHCKN